MAQVDLTEAECSLLVNLIETEIPNLREEIWHTDTSTFKDELKDREQQLVALGQKLRQAGGLSKP